MCLKLQYLPQHTLSGKRKFTNLDSGLCTFSEFWNASAKVFSFSATDSSEPHLRHRNCRILTTSRANMTSSVPSIAATEPINQFDLSGQYAAIGAEVRGAVERVLASQQLVLGQEGAALEKELSAFCSVAHGIGVASASDKGRRTGSLGDIACISFYPTKNLGAAGDGGMIVTNSADLDARLRTLRNHGQASRYISTEPGWNSRLDEIQAAILRVKLHHLVEWQKARQVNAAKYGKLLANVPGISTPVTPAGYEHVFHQYTVRCNRRDALQKFLADRKIGSTIYYPVPLHLQPLYASLGHKPGDFPNAEHVAGEILSLPMYPELTEEKIGRVAAAVEEFARS